MSWVLEAALPRLLRGTVVPAWARYERSSYLRTAARLRRAEGLSADERSARLLDGIREIVAYAGGKSPFYRERFRRAGFDPASLRSLKDLRRIPVLTKQDVRDHGAAMRSEEYPVDSLVAKRTSGSTGVSLHIQADPECMEIRRGITLYRDRWTGWDLGEPKAMVWGNPPPRPGLRGKLRKALLERDFFLDTLRMNESMMRDFAAEILRRHPRLIFGHAHSLFLFARFWKKENLPPYSFRGAISTAMVLHPFERKEIEDVFATRVFDRYGCEEVSLIASECEAHAGLHVNTDGVWVEIEDEPDADAGVAGRILVTDLLNRGMPFIRYEVGDRGRWSESTCPCGRTYPLLDSIAGRVADYLVTPDGDLVSGISLTENFATLIPGVEQVQVIQEVHDHIRVHLVPAPEFGDASRAQIADMVCERFGPAMGHEIVLMDRIAPEPSGKYRFSINRIPAEAPPPV